MITRLAGTGVRGRLMAGVLLVVASLVLGAAPTSGQAPPDDEVSVDEAFAVAGFIDRDCDGEETASPGFASVSLTRQAVGGGSLDTAVTVGVAYSGPVAAALVGPAQRGQLRHR